MKHTEFLTSLKPTTKARRLTALGLGAFAIFASLPADAQIVIQPTTEVASKDTKIYGSVPDSFFTSNLNVTAASTTAHFLSLVEFDLSALGGLTAGEITSASLTLYSSGLGISGVTSPSGSGVTLSPILSTWSETGTGSDLATYNAFFGINPTLFVGSPVASQDITGAGFYTWDITDTVKSWVSGSLENHGLMIQIATANGDVGFADVDSAPGVAGSAPKLTVVPEPATGALLGCVSLLTLMRRRRTHAG